MTKRRAVVVGGGHNGLVVACYLARAGLQVEVLERRAVVGGMCVTEELFPGVKVSSLACRHGMLRKTIIADLNLEAHGLRGYRGDYASHIFTDGSCLNMDFATREGRVQSSEGEIAAEFLAEWDAFWREIGVASKILSEQQENGGLTRVGYQKLLRDAGLEELAERVFEDTLFTFAKSRLRDERLMAAACASNFSHACQPGSLFETIYLDTAESFAEFGQWGYAMGGMGAVTQALLKETDVLGVTVRCGAEVVGVEKDGPQWRVKTAGGVEVLADVVVAGTDPYTLYRKILKAQEADLPEGLLAQVDGMVEEVSKAIIHFKLKDLPVIPGLEVLGRVGERRFHGQVDFSLTPQELEASWAEFERGAQFGQGVNLATNVLTAMDPTLCERGHVWTVVHFFSSSRYKGGDWNTEGRGMLLEDTLAVMRPHVPGLDELIEDYHLITPTDLRDRYGIQTMTPVHVSFERAFENRPMAGGTGYRTPLEGIYLCGSGTNPGAMVTGMPGYLCAKAVLEDLT